MLGLVPALARAQWSAEASVERFHWREDTAPIEVREIGPRFGIGVRYVQPRGGGPLLGGHARFFGGVVDYEGSVLSDPTQPSSGAVTYLGGSEGLELRLRWPDVVDALAGFDFDHWRRSFGPIQREDYQILSARVGLERISSARNPLIAGAGVRILLWTDEDAAIADPSGAYQVSLKPGLGSSPFLMLGARVGPRFALTAYWDGMRLGRSPDVVVNRRRGTGYQPQTDMSTIGLRLEYRMQRSVGD